MKHGKTTTTKNPSSCHVSDSVWTLLNDFDDTVTPCVAEKYRWLGLHPDSAFAFIWCIIVAANVFAGVFIYLTKDIDGLFVFVMDDFSSYLGTTLDFVSVYMCAFLSVTCRDWSRYCAETCTMCVPSLSHSVYVCHCSLPMMLAARFWRKMVCFVSQCTLLCMQYREHSTEYKSLRAQEG